MTTQVIRFGTPISRELARKLHIGAGAEVYLAPDGSGLLFRLQRALTKKKTVAVKMKVKKQEEAWDEVVTSPRKKAEIARILQDIKEGKNLSRPFDTMEEFLEDLHEKEEVFSPRKKAKILRLIQEAEQGINLSPAFDTVEEFLEDLHRATAKHGKKTKKAKA